MNAVHAQARSTGIEPERMDLIGGGYESRFLRLSAYATFRLPGDAADVTRRLEVERPLYFSDWRLARCSVE